MNKQELLRKLRDGVVTVDFMKVNGTRRVMHCTLNNEFLPDRGQLEEAVENAKDTKVFNVWDVDNNGWRSFNFDRVNSYD